MMPTTSLIKSLTIDIETYSSADLSKCGVYKYVESKDFEILLFGYSVNGEDVKVVDIVGGEKIPPTILTALQDDNVIKYSFNAMFERICLSRFLNLQTGTYLNPKSWRCHMIWSAYLGLPLSLKGVGKVLKLDEQKMEEGKELIKYFCSPCTPTKSNGGRTRNMLHHALDKWKLFKSYNKRDVEVELSIHNRIAKYPVPEFVWDEYHIDQMINDRGINLDMMLVDNAISIDEETRGILLKTMQNLTELDNPNSVSQVKLWLGKYGIDVDDLGKKNVARLKEEVKSGDIYDALELRQQLSKSSVKKYLAMKNARCLDNRAHGMFQFYGANRSGRFCLTGDHEILTDNGWVRLDKWNGGVIATWHPNGSKIAFTKAKANSFDYNGILYDYEDGRISQISTPEHKMWVKKRYDDPWSFDTVANMASYRPSIPLSGRVQFNSSLEQNKIRVLIMTQADGCFTENGTLNYGFVKKRKIERCKTLLRRSEIVFHEKIYNGGLHVIVVAQRDIPLWLRQFKNKTFGTWIFDENAEVIFDELPNWDGYRCGPNSIQYATCNKTNADIIQALAHINGMVAKIVIKDRTAEHPNWSIAYYVNIWLKQISCHEIKQKPQIIEYKGLVYCPTTTTGFFIVRRNGCVWVTGNSGRLIQLQNLPQNHMSDLSFARELVKQRNVEALKMLYEDIPATLSELIRTAFIPTNGYKFIVSDFSAIEARVIAWYAHESWRIKAFENGEDIYCESASQMFNVPVKKNGINGHLRQKGKIAELALGYGGGVGALTAMGALEMGLTEDELQPLVNAWRKASPHIVEFWWAVDKAAKKAIKTKAITKTHGLVFEYKSAMLFITLPSGRKLAYVKPRIDVNRFGSESITYEGIGATKKWERIETYGPKLVENIVQATARDILCHSMKTLESYRIVAHVHDELIIEVPMNETVENISSLMAINPDWCKDLVLRADGYECEFYKKD